MLLSEKLKILKICQEVRKNLCDKYAKGYHLDCLPGNCYEASEAIQKRLLSIGIDTVIVQGVIDEADFHYWLEYKEYIIDITASQFNFNGSERFPLINIKKVSESPEYICQALV